MEVGLGEGGFGLGCESEGFLEGACLRVDGGGVVDVGFVQVDVGLS